MSHTVLSYTVVGVWATPLTGIPAFDPGVLQNLFGDPYATTVGAAQDGSIVVRKMVKPPAPTALFGPIRFEVSSPSLEDMTRAFGELRQQAYAKTNQQVPFLSAIGLNSEHEWAGGNLSRTLVSERYVRRALWSPPLDLGVEFQASEFMLTYPGPPVRRFGIKLQPRVNRQDAVYVAINEHREWNRSVPEMKEVAQLLRESVDGIDSLLTPLLFGGVSANA